MQRQQETVRTSPQNSNADRRPKTSLTLSAIEKAIAPPNVQPEGHPYGLRHSSFNNQNKDVDAAYISALLEARPY